MKTKILFISTSDPDYSRVKLNREALKEHFIVDIIESKASSYAVRFASVIIQMFTSKITGAGHDVIYVGFMAQPIFPIVKLLWPKKKIVVDFFFSLFDTLCQDKKLAKPKSITGMLAYFLDRFAINKSSLIITDTISQADYYKQEFLKNEIEIRPLYLGADETIFRPSPLPSFQGILSIEFHGNFIPLQGVTTIVEAASILQEKGVSVAFKIIGDGQTYEEAQLLAKRMKVKNIKWLARMSLAEIYQHIKECHVGLGIFGTSGKAKRVIPNKAYEILASKRLLITEDSEASRELLTHKKNALLTPPGNAKVLSDMIFSVARNPQALEKIATAGHDAFQKMASRKYRSQEVKKLIEKAIK